MSSPPASSAADAAAAADAKRPASVAFPSTSSSGSDSPPPPGPPRSEADTHSEPKRARTGDAHTTQFRQAIVQAGGALAPRTAASLQHPAAAALVSMDARFDAAELPLPAGSAAALSRAQLCHTDGLHCVFAFLPLGQMLPAAHSCRAWMSAALREKQRGVRFHLAWYDPLHQQQLCNLLASPFRLHVSALNLGGVHPTDLPRIAAALPHLHMFEVELFSEAEPLTCSPPRPLQQLEAGEASRAPSAGDMRFPANLHILQLRMRAQEGALSCQAAVDALPQSPALTHVELGLQSYPRATWVGEVNLAGLLRLSHLTRLTCNAPLSVAQLAVVKQLVTLRQLELDEGRWTPEQLAALCSPPHQLLQLEDVCVRHIVLDAASVEELLQLPSLTALAPSRMAAAAFALLPRFPRLRSVSLRFIASNEEDGRAWIASMEEGLRSCRQLTDVALEHVSWSVAPLQLAHACMAAIVRAVPQLRRLRIEETALSNLAELAGATNLTELHISSCRPRLPAEEILALAVHAPGLQSLHLEECTVLSASDLDALRPRSESDGSPSPSPSSSARPPFTLRSFEYAEA